MGDLHFLRPEWLLALPIGAWLTWQLLRGRGESGGWRSVVDAKLRRYVLIEPEVLRNSRLALVVALGAWLAAVLAMAGPAWERLPVPAFRSDEALVVALDLSRSMDAGDVEPSRLARAKLKLLDLLEQRSAGQTALVVFTTHAFTVTPLTTDTRTISSLVGAISTDIMPTHGGSASAGLEKARALLRQTGVQTGDILLITDSEVEDADLRLARDLAGEGFRTSVLAVGTEQGAPIPQAEGGGFLNDANGHVVVPQVDLGGLRRLAGAGRGRFARLAPDDSDLAALFPAAGGAPLDVVLGGGEEQQYKADVWRDRGAWLVLAVLPLLALLFRRGWICGVALVLLLPTPRAHAFEWSDLWLRRDQRAYRALEDQQPARAATLFQDPEWRGAAQYRSGEFDASATTLAPIDSADGQYNRGNALAKAGKIEPAIEAYDRALALNPDHADARYNRDLLKKFLDDHPQQKPQQPPQQQPQDQNGGQDDQGKQGDSKDSDGNADQKDGQKSGERKAKQGEQGKSGDSSADGDSDEQKQKDGEQQQEQNAANAEQQKDGPDSPNKAPGPEDVEKWASEQAAEQWLRRVPQDPGGLLRRKFLYQYQRMGVDQEGKPVLQNGPERKPW
ncbi:MAG TPA: VWA domain-containing protein [Gammaproteobacteria bacterium]|jgi:Ca-activated chloride channel family protein|nr:VWA domain-containing protein [Gammaproteobacteria bacterium]